MIWLLFIIAFVSGIAVGMAIGWEQGYRMGRTKPVTPDEFTELTQPIYHDYCRVCDRTVDVIGPGYRE